MGLPIKCLELAENTWLQLEVPQSFELSLRRKRPIALCTPSHCQCESAKT